MSVDFSDFLNEAVQVNEDDEPVLVSETEDLDDEILDELDEEGVVDDEVESEGDTDVDGDSYEVTVQGEKLKVSLDELRNGYQRDADYRRKTAALAEERKAFEAEVSQASEVFQQVSALEETWQRDPVEVITGFTANTGNPTQALALTIKNLSARGMLDPQFEQMFGIDYNIKQQWVQELESQGLRKQVDSVNQREQKRNAEIQRELQVKQAISNYDAQIDDILESEGLQMTVSERKQFRAELAKYAIDNELTNLKAAYKAKRYEEEANKRKVARETAKRIKAKKPNSAVSRGSASRGNAIPDSDLELNDVIRSVMEGNL